MRYCEFCEFFSEGKVPATGIVYNYRMGVIIPIPLECGPDIILGISLNKVGPYAACQKHILEIGDISGITESYGRPN